MTKWRKMNSAPMDGTPILVGEWIKDGKSEPKWVQSVVTLYPTDETLRTYDAWTVYLSRRIGGRNEHRHASRAR